MSEPDDLNAQIAQRLFGWTWGRCHAQCPYAQEGWHTADGGHVWRLPASTTNPAATALVWQWLETGPWLCDICFPYHYDGKIKPRHVRCEIAYRTGRKGTLHGCAKGIGATWHEALCRAALALAEALEVPGSGSLVPGSQPETSNQRPATRDQRPRRRGRGGDERGEPSGRAG